MKTPKRGEQFFIEAKGVVPIWGRCTGVGQKHISFHVLNGYWDAKLDLETLTVNHGFGSYQAAPILWVGKAPFRDHQYNEAIDWIRSQLANQGSHT